MFYNYPKDLYQKPLEEKKYEAIKLINHIIGCNHEEVMDNYENIMDVTDRLGRGYGDNNLMESMDIYDFLHRYGNEEITLEEFKEKLIKIKNKI